MIPRYAGFGGALTLARRAAAPCAQVGRAPGCLFRNPLPSRKKSISKQSGIPLSVHGEVNPHYLDHVVETSQTHTVEASEDILAANGMKLLAKGARIDAGVKDRLLQHKLCKPLEDCVRVSGGGMAQRLAQTATELLDRHAFLRMLSSSSDGLAPEAMLARLKLSAPMESLLTVYCQHREDKLPHAVTTALLSQGFSRKLVPQRPELGAELLLAGLFHDVGELYINPAYLAKGVQLTPEQWRHIVTHPIVAHRVLKDLPGAGAAIAEPVLQHHERLDGFGYPHGLHGEQLSLPAQILATAELLVGLIESGPRPLSRAAIAMKLIPGEFGRPFIDIVATASQAEREGESAADPVHELRPNLPRIRGIATLLKRLRRGEDFLLKQTPSFSEPLRPLVTHAIERLHRIQLAFSSTGMDIDSPKRLLRHLSQQVDSHLGLELSTVVREIDWRLRELERESLLRAELLSPQESARVRQLIDLMTGHVNGSPAGL